ncbi:uncharacterized protein C12orf71 homolog [Carlito syrichta]|uniref:Uncharacterized protein C12orf71 homolog n=1 Tax=Carlito syrichta TaxID=1868482 RepID=A0A3Q0DZN5_CARSF|nr:uncharacterized protein C12orf71 homolog [Carlito syrichta]
MAHPSSGSDIEDYIPKSKSNLSLSVGYFPCEHNIICEDTTSCGDSSPKVSITHIFPPRQGTWRTEGKGRFMKRRDQIQEKLRPVCKLSIPLAWDVDMGSNSADSITDHDLNRGEWIDKFPKEKTKLTVSKLNGLMQMLETFLENEKDDDSEFPKSTREKDFQLSSSSPPDTVQMIRQATDCQRTSTIETDSISPEQSDKEDPPSNTQARSCLNLGLIFRWLSQRVFSSLSGRKHPSKATKSPPVSSTTHQIPTVAE